MPRCASDDRRWSSADVPGEASTRARRERRERRVSNATTTATTASDADERDGRGRPPRATTTTGTRANETNDATTTARDDAAPSVLQKLQKWGDYESCGDVVRGTRLIPMKTPL